MGQRRLELQTLLENLIGSRNVYFNPPESFKLKYPCIVYKRDLGDTKFADNNPYMFRIRYQLIIVDQNPDSEILEKVAKLPMCMFERQYTADNLNHDVYNIYF
jgi:hypothetical protein